MPDGILGLREEDRPTVRKRIPLESREPGYYRGDPRTFWSRMGDLFREDPEKLVAKAQNALAFSEEFGITPSEAYEYHDEISERIFGEKLTTPELIGGLMHLPITMALASNPVGLVLGVGTYMAIAEAESAAISLAKNEKYQVFQQRGLVDLLPEDISGVTREVIDTLDVIGKMAAAGGIFKTSPKIGRRIARKIMTEHRLPREIYISGKDLKAELQRGNVLPEEEMEFVKALGLKGAEYKTALQRGLNIKVPAEDVITITDRPWYAKFKKLFRISPYEEVRVPGERKPTYEFAAEVEKPSIERPGIEAPPVEEAPSLITMERAKKKIGVLSLKQILTSEESEEGLFLLADGSVLGAVEGGIHEGVMAEVMGVTEEQVYEDEQLFEETARRFYKETGAIRFGLSIMAKQVYVDMHSFPTSQQQGAVEQILQSLKPSENWTLTYSYHRPFKRMESGKIANPTVADFRDLLLKLGEGRKTVPFAERIKEPVEVAPPEKKVISLEEVRDERETAKIIEAFTGGRTFEDISRETKEIVGLLSQRPIEGDQEIKHITDLLEAINPSIERRAVGKFVLSYKEIDPEGPDYLTTVTKIDNVSNYEFDSPKMKGIKEDPDLGDASYMMYGAWSNLEGDPVIEGYDLYNTKNGCLLFSEEDPGRPHFLVQLSKISEPRLVGKEIELEPKNKFEEFTRTLPEEKRIWFTTKGPTKLEETARIFELLEERYPEIESKISRILYAPLADRHAETMGGVITLSTVDAPTMGHEIGELLQPMKQFGRGKTITGEEARERDKLSDAIAYILMEEAGLKTPRKRPSPELLEKAKELLSGEKPEIPSPDVRDIAEEAAREIKNPKTRIRLITGQTKISDLVREDVAFKAALRRAAKEARHALSVGKKEGYEAAKKHYLELRDKAKKRIAQRRYVQKLIDNIARSLSNAIDFSYKEGIENLREGIDPHFRAKKTIGSKERMQKFFADHPEMLAEMPTKFMKELNKKPLNDYTIDDLQQISDEVTRLRKLGKLKRSLKLAQRNREFDETRDTLVSTVSRGGKVKEEIVVRDTKEKAGVRRTARAYSMRPTRIFDKLDRGQQFSGPAHRFFYDEVNKGVDESLRMMDKRFNTAGEKRKSLGISARDLLRTRKIGKVRIAVDEMLDIYVGWKNPRKKLALMYGNNITEELATEIFSKLTDKEKEFADWIISEYDANYSRVREAHIEYANEDMGYEPFYTPIRRMDVTPNKYKSEIAEEILVRSNLKKAYVGKQFTIERKNIPREYQRPIRLGLYNTWLDQIPKQERYISLGTKVKELQKMTSDPDFRQAVRDNFGPPYLEAVEAYNNRVANPDIYKAFTRLEKGSQTLRKNMVMAYLAYNLVTMGKQLPSVLLYLPESGPWHLIAAGLEFATHPIETIRFVNERDPQIKHRMIERELEEMKYSGRVIKKWGRFGMLGIRGMDKLAVTTGWLAVYNRNVGRLGEEEAMRLAQNATLRTQPAAHAKDLPQLYASNEFLNWGLQFTNQLNQIYNIATYDIPQDVKRGRLYKAFLSSLALAMVSMVIWTMSNRRLPEDLEDVVDALVDEAMMAIPLVGRTIAAASKGWEQPSPAFKMWVGLGRLYTEAEREAKAKALVEGCLVMMGIPYTEPRRVIKAVEKGEPMELLGPRKEKKKGRKRYE